MAIARNKNSAKETALALGREERARQVLELALAGFSWVAIGKQLGVSRETARQDVLRANRAALEKRDELAQKMLAKMSADLTEGMNFCMKIIEDVQAEVANIPRLSGQKKPKRDVAGLEKRALLALDRLDRMVHRYSSLTGLYPHDGGNKLIVQGVGTIQLTVGGPPVTLPDSDQPGNGRVVTLPEGDYHAD